MSNNVCSDSFSLRRLGMFAQYYKPLIGRQLIIYCLISVVFFVLSLMPFPSYAQAGIFTLVWTALGFMYQLAPIVLAKSGDSRVIERLIPATACEKFCFYFIYFFIVVPVVVYTLPEISLYLYGIIPSIHTQDMDYLVYVHNSNPAMIVIMNSFSTAAGAATCLLVVLKARRNRVIMGIVSVFVVMVSVGIFGAIWGAAQMFRLGYEQAKNGIHLSEQEQIDSILSILNANPAVTGTMTAIFAIYVFVVLWLTYSALRNSKR